MATTGLRFGVLGTLEVVRDGRPLALGPPLQRAVLARLLLDADRVVSVDRLVDDLWGEQPPGQAQVSLQAYVANLRRTLEPDRPPRAPATVLRTRAPGYEFVTDGHALDLRDFEAAASHVRTLAHAADHHAVREAADAALRLWRGPVLADLVDTFAFARRDADRLTTLRAAVEELRLAALVHGGEHLEAVAELETLVHDDPFRERAWELLVLALYRAGRTADALTRCGEAIALLRDELGIEPGSGLRDLHTAVLNRDPALDPPVPAIASGPAPIPVPPAAPSTDDRVPPTAAAATTLTGNTDAAVGDDARTSTPPRRPELVGRADDAVAVAGMLGTARLVTITGPGGVGKTSLALRVADRAAPRHPDGTVVVELASLEDPALLVAAIGRALGVLSAGDDPRADVVTALRGRRMLLVLDNLEHLLERVVDIATLLDECPELSVLATSRARLSLRGEREYPLAPLELPVAGAGPAAILASPAVRLFLERVEAVLPGLRPDHDELAAIDAICRQLDGLPLAIELAAPWCKVLRPQDLLVRLDAALTLPATGTRDIDARHRTIRDTVAWSYDLLDDAQRHLFVALSVFRGGWTLGAAASVTGDDGPADELELLAQHAALVEHSLIVPDPDGSSGGPRFRMLETVREFGQLVLTQAGTLQQLRSRQARWLVELTDEADAGLRGLDQAAWLRRLDVEHANLSAAIRALLDAGDVIAAARVLWSVRWYVHIRARHPEVRRWLEELTASRPPHPVVAQLRSIDALCAYYVGRWDDIEGSDGSLSIAELTRDAAPDVALTAVLLAAHGAVGRGQAGVARGFALEAAQLARDLEAHWEEGLALLALAQVAAGELDIEDAFRALAEAEATLRRAGAAWGIAVVLNIRVMLTQLAGADDDVRPLLRESLELSGAIGDRSALAYGVTSLAEVLVERGELLAAAELFGAAEALEERTGLVQAPPASRQLRATFVEGLRAQLPAERLEPAWAAGRDRTVDEVVAFALSHCG